MVLALICTAFCLAEITAAGENPTAEVFNRIKMGKGYIIQIGEEAYPEQVQSDWAHNYEAGFSARTVKKFITIEDQEVLTARTAIEKFNHLEAKPEEADLTNVLWKSTRTLERVLNNHVPTGREISQWQIKDGFEIFTFKYQLVVEDLIGVIDGLETLVNSRLISRNMIQLEQLADRKGKTTWFNDPSGQGSHGRKPSSEAEIEAKFKELFGL